MWFLLALAEFSSRKLPHCAFPASGCERACFAAASPAECIVILFSNYFIGVISVFLTWIFLMSFNNFSCLIYFVSFCDFLIRTLIFLVSFYMNCLFMYFSPFSIRFWSFKFLRVFLYGRNVSPWWYIFVNDTPPQHTHCLFTLIMAFIFTLMTPSCLGGEVLINTQFPKHTATNPLLFSVCSVLPNRVST